MYCKSGQSTEEEMYNNESAGPAFEEFLQLLGERVRLKGFEKYRAQLDTKSKAPSFIQMNENRVSTCTNGQWYVRKKVRWDRTNRSPLFLFLCLRGKVFWEKSPSLHSSLNSLFWNTNIFLSMWWLTSLVKWTCWFYVIIWSCGLSFFAVLAFCHYCWNWVGIIIMYILSTKKFIVRVFFSTDNGLQNIKSMRGWSKPQWAYRLN